MTDCLTTKPSLRETLRAATDRAHRALEDALPLLRPEGTRADYVAFLRRMFGMHQPVEQQLLASAPYRTHVKDAQDRARTWRLQGDLLALGAWLPAPERAPILPPMDSLPAALGVSYVFEGSTLGGQVLHRALAKRYDLPSAALTYIAGYGIHTGRCWRHFLAALEGAPLKPAQQSEVVQAAQQTFELLHDWLARPVPASI